MKTIKFCPECKSTNISFSMVGDGLIRDKCEDCLLEAVIFPEIEIKE